ncbi:MurR/RpiR family transcriptional regulator [Virgibacillus sp. W0430]|uniref:MurR/RpiR family transcriptional regulator n=1 Tax=Virgibacillus sp. W0430 TaxID=3391580 RepID=UPI003F483B7E
MEPFYIRSTKEKFSILTKGLKKVGDYLLTDPFVFAIHTAKKVGSIIGVSETTVLRFCNEIGYDGYSTLQKDVRKFLLNLNQRAAVETDHESVDGRFAQSIAVDMKNLKTTIDHLDENTMEEAVNRIVNSEKIMVVGFYQSFTYAHWCYFNLNYILGNVLLYRPEADAGLLDLMPKNACIILFSYYRYALQTIQLAEEAKNKGIKIISITDSLVSPIAQFSDVVISINAYHKSLIDKGPATISVINALLFECMQQVKDRGKIKGTYKYLIRDGEV